VTAAFNARGYNYSLSLFRQGIDSFRQTEIELGQTAFAVGGENQAHLIVTDVDIRMVLLISGHFGHCIHEIDRVGEIIKLKSALDVLLLQFPFGDFFETSFQLVRFHQISHNEGTSNIPKLFCNVESQTIFSLPAAALKFQNFPQILRRIEYFHGGLSRAL